MWMKSGALTVMTGVIMFALGAGTGALLTADKINGFADEFARMQPVRESAHSYDFIDPLLTCMFPESDDLAEYASFEQQLQKSIDDFMEKQKLQDVAYYFRDLDHGRWVGINEEHGFEPASLFKVPVMMAYYQAADEYPEILATEITYTAEAAAGADSERLAQGETYTVDELITLMITESDNVALNLLLSRLNEQALREIFTDLNIPFPEGGISEPYTISPRKYSLFFRVLYNGTYLSPSRSEQALKLMSQTTFDHGLTSSLPDELAVSHKFGERRLVDAAGQTLGYELHDCGIVYYPEHPYFLCVFTKGEHLEDLTEVQRHISELTYQEMETLYSSNKR